MIDGEGDAVPNERQTPGSHAWFYSVEPDAYTNSVTGVSGSEDLLPNPGKESLTNFDLVALTSRKMQRVRDAARLDEMTRLPDDVLVGIGDASLMLNLHRASVRRLYHDGLLNGRQN